MPEEYYGGCYTYLYIKLNDSSFCSRNMLVNKSAGPGCGLNVGPLQYPRFYTYKQGLGQVYYSSGDGDGNVVEDKLYSYQKNGIRCKGIPGVPSGLETISLKTGSFYLYPQPAGNTVYLEAPQLSYPAIIRIQNLQGQLLSTQELSAAGKPISTANLPAGLYLLSVTDAGGNSGVQKFLIEAN